MVPKSEPAVIRHFVERALFDGAISKLGYGAAVADHVMDTVPEAERALKGKTGRGKGRLDFHVSLPSDDVDALDWKRRENAKKVMKAVEGETYLPALLRRSSLACLPEPYQTECRRQLFRDEGYQVVPLPGAAKPDAGAIHQEYADVARSGGELRADDGRIDENDPLDKLRAHQKELLDVIESATAELQEVEAAIRTKTDGKAGLAVVGGAHG